MPTPFPGMDPYLEHPAIWPDVHNSLIAAAREALASRVAPRYYIGLESRTYLLQIEDTAFLGKPDLSVFERRAAQFDGPREAELPAGPAVLDVAVPMMDEVREWFFEVREVGTSRLVTVVELLSPANKRTGQGREDYEEKRRQVLATRTNLVEIDLLRAGVPMPVIGGAIRSDYRILISRGAIRPRAHLHAFTVRQPIPPFTLPLLSGDDEPEVDLGGILHSLYDRVRFDLLLNYDQPAVPPLDEADAEWARSLRPA